jgi:biotin transport system substrate-specific component
MFGTPSSDLASYNISLFKKLVLLVAGVAVLAISAHIKVPFYPVPITMQTLVVMLIGFTYGIRLGSSTVLVYLALGAIGAPVFAGGAGLAYMSGPTGGYLFGFLVAVYLIGYFTEQGYGRTFISTLFLALSGTIVFYLFGVTWLTTILGFEKAIKFGLLPFLYGDVLKLFLLAFSIPATWKLVLKLSKRDS